MATVEVTKENLETLITDSNILLIDFWAEWCGPCRGFAPVFEKSAETNGDIVHAKCDTEAQREVAGAFGIRSIPTIAAFKDGIMVFKQAGALPAPALASVVDQIKALDMDEVRQKIAEEQAKDGAAE